MAQVLNEDVESLGRRNLRLARGSYGLIRWLPLPAFVLASLFIATSLLAVALFHFRIIVGDDWGFYWHFLNKPFWISIWEPRNGHRLFFPGLLDKINLLFFSGSLINLVIVGVVVQTASALMLAQEASIPFVRRSTRWLMLALVLALMLWMSNGYALVWSFGLTYTLGVFGAVAACHCLFRCWRALGGRGYPWLWIFGAVMSAVIASLSWGSGVVIWPILVLMAWGLGLPRTTQFFLLIAAIAFLVVYFFPVTGGQAIQPRFPNSAEQASKDVLRLLAVVGNAPAFVLASFTSTASHAFVRISRVIGGLAIVGWFGLLAMWWGKRKSRQWLLPLIAVGLFALGTATLIGLERGGLISRFRLTEHYRIFSTLLWVILFLGYFGLALLPFNVAWRARSLAGIVVVMLLILLPSQIRGLVQVGEKQNRVEKGTLAIVTGTMDMGIMWRVFSFDKSQITALATYLRRNRLTVFQQQWTHWMNARLLKMASAKRLEGGIADASPQGNGYSIKGMMARAHPGALIVGVDSKGRIRAMAFPNRGIEEGQQGRFPFRPLWLRFLCALDPRLPTALGWGRGWSGYAMKASDPYQLRYFLVTQDKKIIGQLKR